MNSKQFKELVKANKKKISKLALRCVLPLEINEDQEDAMVRQISDLRENLNEEELASQEMDDLLKTLSQDDKSVSKYIPAYVLNLGQMLYGSFTFINAAKIAIIAATFLNKNDVSFFLDKKIIKRGNREAAEIEIRAEEQAAPATPDEEPTAEVPAVSAPPERKKENKRNADEVLAKISDLLKN